MQFQMTWPPMSVMRAGALEELGPRAKALGTTKALIVTDAGLVACGIADRVAAQLGKSGIAAEIFAEVQPNPTMKEVRNGVSLWKSGGFDLLVGLGGGSSMDAAKVIAAILLTGRPLIDLVKQGVDDVEGKPVPFIVLPTTSGTGSEATSAAMIKDDDGRKYLVRSLKCRPTVAFLDPELTLTVPPRMTAATGIDAFIHALGAYTNTSANAVADVAALEAMRLVFKHLVRTVETGSDLEARTGMMLASYLAGIAISAKGNDAIHGLSTAVESLVDVTHGESLSAIMPYVLRFNVVTEAPRYANVARAVGLDVTGLSDAQAAEKAVTAITELRDRLKVARTLAELGVQGGMIPRLTELAAESRSTQINCRKLERADIQALYEAMV
ncbi:iron-containing alcohol dehydrogenase family protein [Mesorhizobium sp. ANAO-SY3R2]|uniref:iron-containing alcohol dehydrogenase family protein n=1 Tax=Mesorhizobium sp. ANAO-SY3R2 TaxID=3166644 RepID=UPI00366B87A3